MALNPQELQAACLDAYERARRNQARQRVLLLAFALSLLSLLLAQLGWLRAPALLGSALCLLGLVYWSSVRGGSAWQGARLGLQAGLLPLAAGLVSEGVGVTCTPGGCSSWCVPACASAGVLAVGWLLQRGLPLRTRSETRVAVALDGWFWGSAAVAVIGLGALGCACVSYGGAMAVALVVSLLTASSAALVPARASA